MNTLEVQSSSEKQSEPACANDKDATMAPLAVRPHEEPYPVVAQTRPMPQAGRITAPSRDIYQEVLRALHGRWRLAITLGAFLAIVGAAAAYAIKVPMYRATGLIRIAYTLPQVLQETDQNRPMSMFDAYLNAQAQVLRSRSIVEPALQELNGQPALAAAGHSSIQDFVDDLTVEHPAATDHLRISYEHESPDVAAAAVNALVKSYSHFYASQVDSMDQQRLGLLEKQDQLLTSKLEALNRTLTAVTQDAGGMDIESRYGSAVQRVNMLQARLADVRMALGGMSGPKTTPTTQPQEGAAAAPANQPPELSLDQIARTDPTMSKLLQDRAGLQEAIDLTRQRYGYGDAHPEIAVRKTQLDGLNQRITKYASDYRDLQAEIRVQVDPMKTASAGAAANVAASDAALQLQERVITRMADQANQDLAALASKRQQVVQLTGESSKLREEGDTIERRIRSLQLEAGLGGRFQIISAAEPPLRPFSNPRKKFMAAAAFAGACTPAALLILFGLLSSRFRLVHQTEAELARKAPLLGILPTLSDDQTNPALSADAAHCVHQVRVLLQMSRPLKSGRSVYMVTSACSGEGKTSVTVALGLSFAASGCKTLIVDCDLIGQGLTHGFGAIGEPGLREAMTQETARGLVKKLPRGLRVLTAGNVDRFSGWTLSTASTLNIISEVRRYYDVVLIDTGPVLGSVEASVLAPEVDGVILTIARGQQRTLVERAIRHLDSLGVKPMGFLFNRARSADFKRAVFSSSARGFADTGGSRPAAKGGRSSSRFEDAMQPAPQDIAGFGPLVRSVASFMIQPDEAHTN